MSKSLAHWTVGSCMGVSYWRASSRALFWIGFKMKGSQCVVKMIQRNWCHVHSTLYDHVLSHSVCSVLTWCLFWHMGKKHFHMLSEPDYCHWLPSDLTEHKGPWEHTLSFCDMWRFVQWLDFQHSCSTFTQIFQSLSKNCMYYILKPYKTWFLKTRWRLLIYKSELDSWHMSWCKCLIQNIPCNLTVFYI